MKKTIRSILTIILCAVMAFSSTMVAFADTGVTPVVMVHGMGSFGLFKNPNTNSEEPLESFNISTLMGSDGLLRKLLRVANGENVDPQEIMDALSDFMAPFEDVALDKNGNPKNNIGINSYWEDSLANHKDWLESKNNNEPAIYRQVCDRVGANNVYAFNYDWRLDAVENAKKLNSFIDMVKSKTGKNKVTLFGGSEGTVVCSAYIDMYKNKNDIEKLVFLDGAFKGVSITNAFKQDLYINGDVLQEYIKQFCYTYNGMDFNVAPLALIVGIFSNVVNNLAKYLNQIVNDKNMLNSVYTDVLKPMGNIPILWEFIPYDSFDDAVKKMSAIGFLDKNSGLYDKITRYHKIQGRVDSNLKALKNKGVEIAIIANYGTPGIPVTSGYKNQTDILIDLKYASGGATVADYGTTFNKSGKYVSDDKIVDASSCVLPDNTWFVKSIQHMNYWYDTEATNFLAEIIATKKPLNIKSVQQNMGVGQFVGTTRRQEIVSVLECGTDRFGKRAYADEGIIENSNTKDENGNSLISPPTSAEEAVAPIMLIALGFVLISIVKKES